MCKIHPVENTQSRCILCLESNKTCYPVSELKTINSKCICNYKIHKACLHQIKNSFDCKCPVCKIEIIESKQKLQKYIKTECCNLSTYVEKNNIFVKKTRYYKDNIHIKYYINEYTNTTYQYDISIRRRYFIILHNKEYIVKTRYLHKTTFTKDHFMESIERITQNALLRKYNEYCINKYNSMIKRKRRISLLGTTILCISCIAII